ncbi:DUF1367 family protein [Vibrio breoganii]|uniref:DUF1367 family protein n=1 Tax=Vibrio breoganii TaxID=553239 RepID=A0AAP8SWS8_9VIBR|nr:DUF1367 family protein [Vibrio breoganii]PMP10240.1 hypothetical protein BCS93_11230 [Vibrio breoganii]
MAKLSLVVTASKQLAPFSPEDDALLSKRRIGTVIEATFKANRNPQFHRKFMSLLRLGFDYWTPVGGAVSESEKDFLSKYSNWVGNMVGQQDTMRELAGRFIQQVAIKRADYEVEKDFEAYRKAVVAESGYYYIVALPNGTIKKQALSISFASMDEDGFNALYKACFNTVWNQVLQYHFETKQDAYNATQQMLEYT